MFLKYLCLNLLTAAVSLATTPMQAAFSSHIENGEIAGALALVASRDGLSQSLCLNGYANLEEKRALTNDTIFWIASMTKPVTGTAIMILAEQGKIDLDAPICRYLPQCKQLRTADGKPATVTIRQCLNHTSGLQDLDHEILAQLKTLDEHIERVAALPLHFEPGSQWRYCQSSINLAARVVEVVSGETFPEFIERTIFAPLGMTDTTFVLSAEQAKRLATPYERSSNGQLKAASFYHLFGKTPTDKETVPLAAWGLFSTASDYTRFLRAILNGGSLDGTRILDAKSVAEMLRPTTGNLPCGFTPGTAWALGWCIVVEPQGVTAPLSKGSFGHGGAYGTQGWADPHAGANMGITTVLMVQRTNFENGDASTLRAAFQQAAAETLALRQP